MHRGLCLRGGQLVEDTDGGETQVSGTTCCNGLGCDDPAIIVFLLEGCATWAESS